MRKSCMKWIQGYVHLPFLFAAIGCLPLQFHALEEPERSLNDVRCLEIEDEAQHFYESSEFEMPANAQIVLSCDDHNGFHWDGEYYVVFDTTAEVIEAYLESSLWNAKWQNGVVPEEISSNTALSNWDRSTFTSSEVWYLAENRNTMLPFHNGRLLVILPNENRVFYSQWDF